MAKSIRISEALYELAEQASAQMSRSLAQQLEHWARIGAALDASGLTTGQVMELMGKSNSLAEQVLALMLVKDHQHRGAPEVVKAHAKNEAAVAVGKKSARRLLVIPRRLVVGAKMTHRSPEPKGQGW